MREREWDREHLGQTVRYARTAKGFTSRKRFAEAAGVSARSIDALEAGDRVGDKVLSAVERALGWEPRTAEHVALRDIDPAAIRTRPPSQSDPGTLEWFRDLRRTLPESKFFEVVDQMTRMKAEEVSTRTDPTAKHAASNGPDEQS